MDNAIYYIIKEENFQNHPNHFRTTFNNPPKANITPKPIFKQPTIQMPLGNSPLEWSYSNSQIEPINFQTTLRPVQNSFLGQTRKFNENFNSGFPSHRSQFPNQLIPVQPIPVKQQCPTNSQVFGRPKIVFVPTN